MKITINLIPTEKKEELRMKKNGRRIVKISLMAYLAMFVLAFFIYGCLLVIQVQKDGVDQELANLSNNNIFRQTKDEQNIIKEYYQRANYIEQNFNKQRSYWAFFQELNSQVPTGIDFTELKIEDKLISIKGVGKTRDEVIRFRDNLQKSNFFNKVNFPISNFTQDKDVNFDFNIELK